MKAALDAMGVPAANSASTAHGVLLGIKVNL